MSSLEAVRYERGKLEVLDQLRLPHEFHYDEVATSEAAFDCIKSMRVRGTTSPEEYCMCSVGTRSDHFDCQVPRLLLL